MPRRKRNWYPGGWFHVIMRGNNRGYIYQNHEDMLALYACIDEARDRYEFTIIAYCFMTNHYHLLIRSPEVPLQKKTETLIILRVSVFYLVAYFIH